MKKERLMALFIGSILIMSVAGFALSGVRFGSRQEQNKLDFPNVVDRELTTEELTSILQNGMIIVEDFYEINCTECIERNAFLQTFFAQFKDFAILSIVEANETSVQIIGSGGRIKDITDMEFTQENMMDAFCEAAIAQPRECLLAQI